MQRFEDDAAIRCFLHEDVDEHERNLERQDEPEHRHHTVSGEADGRQRERRQERNDQMKRSPLARLVEAGGSPAAKPGEDERHVKRRDEDQGKGHDVLPAARSSRGNQRADGDQRAGLRDE